jgi:hypothetical protein
MRNLKVIQILNSMRLTVLYLSLLFVIQEISAQTFVKKFDGPGTSFPYKLLITEDSNFLCTSRIDTLVDGFSCIKIDRNGDTLWTRNFFSQDSGYLNVNDIINFNDSSILIAASYSNSTYKGVYVFNVDLNGDTIWSKTLLDPNQFGSRYKLIKTFDKGIMMLGDGLISLDSIGNLQWAYKYPFLSPYNIFQADFIQRRDSDFIISAYSGDSAIISCVNKHGSILWRKIIYLSGLSTTLFPNRLVETVNNNFLLTTFTGCILHFNSVGDSIWTTRVGPGPPLPIIDLEKIDDSHYLLGGQTSNTDMTYDVLDSSGHICCGKSLSIPNFGYGQISRLSNGQFILSGSHLNNQFPLTPSWSLTMALVDSGFNTLCDYSTPFNFFPTPLICTITNDTNISQILVNFQVVNPANIVTTRGCNVIDLCSTTLVENVILENPIRIYPNPSNGIFRVVSKNSISKIVITNIFGECIFQTEYFEDLDLTSIPKGIYFMTAEFASGNHQAFRIVFQ